MNCELLGSSDLCVEFCYGGSVGMVGVLILYIPLPSVSGFLDGYRVVWFSFLASTLGY